VPDPGPQPSGNARRLLCPRCGYNVGPTSDWTPGAQSSCPECGRSFDADKLAKETKLKPITTGEVVWHVMWPGLLVFGSSLLPVISLLLMPIAVLTLLIINGFTNAKVARRITHQRADRTPDDREEGSGVVGTALWLGQAALMGLAAFGGCSIVLGSMSFH